jgi:hypothetical protein
MEGERALSKVAQERRLCGGLGLHGYLQQGGARGGDLGGLRSGAGNWLHVNPMSYY